MTSAVPCPGARVGLGVLELGSRDRDRDGGGGE